MSYFRVLWSNYPDSDPCNAKNEKGKILFPNQCAIRLSYAMKKSGVNFASFPSGRKCWVHKGEDHILAAKELADWIDRGVVSQIKKSVDVTGRDWRDKVVGKTGIICFEDYYVGSDGSGGDHIDLWNGSALTALGSWFRTRFSIVVPGYWSDFRRSKKIRFFEVK
ncbi:type VI secretion system amidase effector protein Tae4 [Candidatus Thiosymbion oneisti]|uniref:type VI secretion system amidase effector protein Tae4 n=1 Tax=Candidatus Thiosymbion oneisti TaxID=589554 RepID=UPI000AFA5C72|nr:type VI secretion system amidase effector protein Tae4 [Candidatus Thiosymbion oneisti]